MTGWWMESFIIWQNFAEKMELQHLLFSKYDRGYISEEDISEIIYQLLAYGVRKVCVAEKKREIPVPYSCRQRQ